MNGNHFGNHSNTTSGTTPRNQPPISPLTSGNHPREPAGTTTSAEGVWFPPFRGEPPRPRPDETTSQAHRLIVGDVIRGALDDNHINLTPTIERAVIARALELLDVAGYTLTLATQETDRASS